MSDWALYAKAYSGGVLVGLASLLLLMLNGRIAGISGIVGGACSIVSTPTAERAWRGVFIAGMLAAAVAWQYAVGPLPVEPVAGMPVLAIAGLLVGFGTSMGSGCTSGHGVCGIGMISPRSVVATIVFMVSGMATVTVLRVTGALA